MALTVTALMVTVKDSNGSVKYLYRGDVVPDGTAKASVEHLRSLGYVTEGKASGDDKPAGNASRDDWAAYAKERGASDDEVKEPADGGLTRGELREKYGN